MVQGRADAREQARRVLAREEELRLEAERTAAIRRERQQAAEATQQLRDEEGRREALFAEARRWRDATVLREYIAHLAEKTCYEITEEMLAWLAWARMAAGELDPTAERLAQEGGLALPRTYY